MKNIPTFDEFVNEAKEDLWGVMTPGRKKLYARLIKPTTVGKVTRYSWKDGSHTFKGTFRVDQNISNDVKLFYSDPHLSYYPSNNLLFIKGHGIFRTRKVSKEEYDKVPEEYRKYIELKK